MTRKEFIDNYADVSVRQSIRNNAFVAYVLILINLMASFATSNGFSFIIISVYLVLTLGFHIGRSKGCAIAVLAISSLDCVLTIIFFKSVSSIIFIVLGISAVMAFVKADKQRKAYEEGTYRLPDEMFE